ncbi:MAG: TrbM/KikA/MpfK family conjugal transfer protein [Methylotenera sp.]
MKIFRFIGSVFLFLVLNSAKADDGLLEGIEKLACEAKVCLTAPDPSKISECAPSIEKYNALLAISGGTASAFLAKCPMVEN